ncbi:hypothetical protein HMPREF9538_00558, partial [Klebsiella sp. MS 92-3]
VSLYAAPDVKRGGPGPLFFRPGGSNSFKTHVLLLVMIFMQRFARLMRGFIRRGGERVLFVAG